MDYSKFVKTDLSYKKQTDINFGDNFKIDDLSKMLDDVTRKRDKMIQDTMLQLGFDEEFMLSHQDKFICNVIENENVTIRSYYFNDKFLFKVTDTRKFVADGVDCETVLDFSEV